MGQFLEEGEELFLGFAELFGEFGEFDEDFGEFVALAGCHAFVECFGDAGEHAFFGGLHEDEVADFLADDGENEAGAEGEVLGRAGEDVGELFEHGLKRQKVKTPKCQNTWPRCATYHRTIGDGLLGFAYALAWARPCWGRPIEVDRSGGGWRAYQIALIIRSEGCRTLYTGG
ncbi:MAG: hypothetical protein IPK83_07360 [Planctomycetes bacterium]|nr:hypothetical protein [Planctomycetota bacterium]